MAKERNYEFRTVKSVPFLEVSRDGELQYKKGKEKYDSSGKRYRPEHFLKNSDGDRMSIQMAIYIAFPDIPMRYTPPF